MAKYSYRGDSAREVVLVAAAEEVEWSPDDNITDSTLHDDGFGLGLWLQSHSTPVFIEGLKQGLRAWEETHGEVEDGS